MDHTEDLPLVAKKRDKGFTLVELLIVIVILGILATVTVFAVRGITNNSKTSACAADRNTLRTAAEAYYAQNSFYPAAETDMVPGFMATASPKYNYIRDTTTTYHLTVQSADCGTIDATVTD